MIPAPWESLIENLLEAVWLVEPVGLRVVAVNQTACDLSGVPRDMLVGRPAVELTATPEDMFFWEDVAAGLVDTIHTETLLRGFDGVAIPVERRVSRVRSGDGGSNYVVGLRDMRHQQQAEQELETLIAELRATLESTGDAVLVCGLDGAIRHYNRRFAELWSVPEALLLRRDDVALHDHMAQTVADPTSYLMRLSDIARAPLMDVSDVLALKSGQLLERISLPQFSRGLPIGRVYSFRDITQRTEAQARLRLAAKVFESSLDAIFITGADFKILAVNPTCIRLTGCTLDVLGGTASNVFFHDPHDDFMFEKIHQNLMTQGFWEGEVWRAREGLPDSAMQVSWVLIRDDDNVVQQSACFFRDMTDKLVAQKQIETLAYRDALTGLPNRLLLSQRVDFALQMLERNGGTCAVFFLDLDRFKNINDSMGHEFGDQVLIEVARRILLCLRDVDTLCRLGGDEFVVFLQDADAHGAEIAAHRILESLAKPFDVSGMNLSVGCSMGVALYPDDGKSLDELVKCADTAMYRVKERGRGSFRFYQPQMNVDLRSRMKMDHAMRQAMEKGEFQLHYQPQISLQDQSLVGAEALIRWSDSEFGNVSPAVFIPLAEESGYIVTIGNWVLEEAVRQAAIWQSAGTPVVVSINVSALQFQQSDFVALVDAVLRAAGLQPCWLELELTESILVKDANEALERLHALAALGVSLSIDDFGTGYSSLAYLKKFPISKLKIDRSFITGLPQDESDKAIVSATIAMARALKLKVVAEGVETLVQRDCLKSFNCESFQGWLCSKALPPGEFEQFVKTIPTPTLGALSAANKVSANATGPAS